MVADPPGIVAMHAVEGFDDRTDHDVEAGFLFDLAPRRILQ